MHKVNEVVEDLVSKSQERPPTPTKKVANHVIYVQTKIGLFNASQHVEFVCGSHLKLTSSRKTPSSSNFIQCDWCQGPNLVFFEIQMSDIAFLGLTKRKEEWLLSVSNKDFV